MASPADGTVTVPALTSRIFRGRAAPAPPSVGGSRYRYQQPQLFQQTPVFEYPSRMPGGGAFPMERFGPTAFYVAPNVGWTWTQVGGDWIDANSVRHGPAAWATAALNAVSGSSASASYTVDVTALVQKVQADSRWLALLLRTTGSVRALGGTTHPAPPRLEVTYSDGSTGTLACIVASAISTGSAFPSTLATNLVLPVMLEFARPSGPVTSAQLVLQVTQHWSGSATMNVMLIDPPVNTEPVTHGIANGAALDAGLPGHPGIIGVHRILDGTTLDDFCSRAGEVANGNFNSMNAYDPAIYGVGPQNLSRLPHVSAGRWLLGRDAASLVESTYTGEGFQPLAPGVAAIRLYKPAEVFADGAIVGYSTSSPVNAKLCMPPEHFGTLDEIYVRYYWRIGTPDGQPMVNSIATRYQQLAVAGAVPQWADAAGKFLIFPAHDCTEGGVSGTSGGGWGWQFRAGWHENDLPEGPDVGGWGNTPHFYDFQAKNPPGHRYGVAGGHSLSRADTSFAQIGGLGGLLYAHHWYCIELRLKLNSVDQPGMVDGVPHVIAGEQQYWSPDGIVQVWVDGRLAYSKTGLVLRSLPLQINASQVANNPANYIPPVGNLGVRDLWLNIFHGGKNRRARPQIVFLTGLAWGTQRIGPMRLQP